MPHILTFDGLKFSGLNRANPNDSPGPTHDTGATGEITGQNSKAIVWPQYQPQADGPIRLRHIKADVSPSREVNGVSDQMPQLRNGIRDVDVGAEMLLPVVDALTNAGEENYTEVEWTYRSGGGQSDLSVLRDGDWNDLSFQPAAVGKDALVQEGIDFTSSISSTPIWAVESPSDVLIPGDMFCEPSHCAPSLAEHLPADWA